MSPQEPAHHPPADPVAEENRRLKMLLQAAQRSGRLMLWERDRITGAGSWEPHLFELLGLPSQDGPPDVDRTTDLIDRRDRERVRKAYATSLASPGSYEERYRMRRPDGGLIHVHAIWVVPEQGSRVLGMLIDDTEAQQRAGQNEQARQQLAMLSRIIGLFLWRRDYESDRFFLGDDVWLPAGTAPIGAGLTSPAFRAMVHPDDLGTEIPPGEADAAGDEPIVAEIRFRDPGGRYRTMLTRRVLLRDAAGRATGMLGVGVDVTEQVDERERHRQLLERFDLLVETTGIGVWSWDLATDAQEWNDAMRSIYGLRDGDPLPATGLGDAVSSAVHEPDRERVAAALDRVVHGGAARADVNFRIRRPDGELRMLAGRAQRLMGQPRMLCGVVLDVTESHRAEQALREKDLAERADRAKSAFLSRVSHELRTPLNAVLGFTELLLGEVGDEPLGRVQRQRVEQVHQAGRHLLGLVDDLLDIGRHGAVFAAGDTGQCELDQVIEQVLAWHRPVADAAGIRLGVTGQAPAVVGGERHWRQVLSNLVSNAIKFNRRGGWVELTLSQAGVPPWPQLTVRDNGRGLSNEQQQHLFEPFNRLGAERDGIPGTGLGLSIVRQLVQAMGGDVDVESEPGSGTVVRLRIPPAGPPDAGADRASAAVADAPAAWPSGAADVVYVEDNAVNVMLVQEILKQRPQVRLHVAGTVADALPLIRRLRPVLLLADMHLPDGDGLSLLSALHADGDRPARHCVALSADAMPDEVARARAGGFDDYWAKPIQLSAFLAGVDRLLASR